jgi:hypothetical protein
MLTVEIQKYTEVSGASYDSSQGGYTFPCSATLPTLSILIGPTYYATIPASLLNFGVATGSTCFGALQSVGSGTQNIYGDVFFVSFLIYAFECPRSLISLPRMPTTESLMQADLSLGSL